VRSLASLRSSLSSSSTREDEVMISDVDKHDRNR
jgi:hypothetical protein